MADSKGLPQSSPSDNAASRRQFLKGVVIVTGGALAVGGTGAAIASANHQDLPNVIQSFTSSASLISGAKSGACLTDINSPFQPLPGNEVKNTHKFMLWFWVNNVPQTSGGITYTLDYTLTLVSGPGPAPGAFPLPFGYVGGGNNQHNYIYAIANTVGCPGTVPASNKNGATLADIASVKLKGSPSHSDILWQLELAYGGATPTGDSVYQFQGTVNDGMGNTISSSISITVTA